MRAWEETTSQANYDTSQAKFDTVDMREAKTDTFDARTRRRPHLDTCNTCAAKHIEPDTLLHGAIWEETTIQANYDTPEAKFDTVDAREAKTDTLDTRTRGLPHLDTCNTCTAKHIEPETLVHGARSRQKMTP